MEIIILGAGHFGTALAQHYRKNNFAVHLLAETSPWPQNVSKNSCVFICVPTQKLPLALSQRATNISNSSYIVSTCKGLVESSLLTASQQIHLLFPSHEGISVLSGPSFASELSRGLPTALVISSRQPSVSENLCNLLSCGNLRLYMNSDPIGVEYCGALKNIYAILSGICYGMGLGENAKASLNTRALSELSRFVAACGGSFQSAFGLAGVGDLFLTASSTQSRNFRFGIGLARNEDFETLLEELGTVEGYWTTFVAKKTADEKNIRAPLIQLAFGLLMKTLSIEQAFAQALSREIRAEFD